jgi:hypothetical protein
MGGSADLSELTEQQVYKQRNEEQNQLGQDLLKGALAAGTGFA